MHFKIVEVYNQHECMYYNPTFLFVLEEGNQAKRIATSDNNDWSVEWGNKSNKESVQGGFKR